MLTSLNSFIILSLTMLLLQTMAHLKIQDTKKKSVGKTNLSHLRFRGPCIVSIFVLIYFQRDATLHSSFISGKLLYMFRVVSSPIIRSTYNCIYSICYLLTISAVCLYCGRVGAGLSVVWELYRSLNTVICAPDDG